MRQKPKSYHMGFTLIELMVTIGVLVIILGYAMPNFTQQIRDNQSLTFGEEFAAALNYVRSEAVKRGELVSICASNDAGTDCGNDWSNGWLAFMDEAGSETDDSENVGEVLRYWDPAADGLSLTVTQGGNDLNFIRFADRGTLARIEQDPVDIMAGHDECTGNAARQLRVGLSGSVNMRRADC